MSEGAPRAIPILRASALLLLSASSLTPFMVLALAPEVVRGETADDDASSELQEQLEALGYVGAEEMQERNKALKGVVHVDRDRYDERALYLYIPNGWGLDYRRAGFGAPMREARLLDGTGRVLHRWRDSTKARNREGWPNARVNADGSLFAIHLREALLKLDWSSNVLWRLDIGAHHDLAVAEDGSIVVLVEETRTIDFEGRRINIRDSGIAFVSPDGELQRTLWLYDSFRETEQFKGAVATSFRIWDRAKANGFLATHNRLPARLARVRQGLQHTEKLGHRGNHGGIDPLHANTVEILPADPDGRWQEGDILTALRTLNTIAVIGRETGEILYQWGYKQLWWPHDPSLMKSGNFLIFDNGRKSRGSRVIELDTRRNEIVWSYDGGAENPFWSSMRGEAQELENGHIFIVDGQTSRAFEITREGDIVWDFYGDDIRGNFRVPIRMNRLSPEVSRALRAKLGRR